MEGSLEQGWRSSRMRQVENLARKSTDKISCTIGCRVRAIEFAERMRIVRQTLEVMRMRVERNSKIVDLIGI